MSLGHLLTRIKPSIVQSFHDIRNAIAHHDPTPRYRLQEPASRLIFAIIGSYCLRREQK